MSRVNNISDGVLRLILESMNEKFNEEGITVDLDNYNYSDDIPPSVDDVVKYFGISDLTYEEIGFFVQLYVNNPNFNNLDVILKRPTLKKFIVQHSEDVKKYELVVYESEILSYMDLNESIIRSMQYSGDYDYWDGRVIEEDVYDTDTIENDIKSIKRIDE